MKKQSSTATASKNVKVNKLIQRQEKELNKARRQLEIEAALERVRSLTMVMKHSGELSEIILTVYKELRQLDMALTRTLIWLFSENPDMFEVWVADTEADKSSFVMRQEVEHPYHKRMFEKWKERKSKWVYINEGEGKKDLDDYLFTKTAAVAVPEEVKAGIRAVDRIVNTFSFHNFGGIQADGAEELSDEKFEILHRFAKEFDLAYTRFLDLQKAEEQVLEAQIEAGLERVRAQAMAMHRTDDLVLTIEMFYEQMSILLDTPIVRCGAGLLNKKNSICELASASKNDNGKTFSVKGNIDMNGHPLLKNTYNHWLEQKEYYHVLSGSEIKKYYQYMTNQVAIHDFTDDEEQHFYFPMFSEGSFYVITKRELREDELRVFRRFSSVLSLTYRRFNDLKRAEKQAREAEIEVALERIRSSSLAMQKSEELQKIVTVVIKELLELGVALDAGGGVIICTYIKDSKDFLQWMASPDFSHSGSYLLPYFDHPIMNDSWKFKESGVDFSSKSYSEEEKNSFFKHSFEHSDHKYFHNDLKKWILQTKKYVLSWAWSKNSAILIPSHTGVVPSESEKEILIRFSRVFDQAYTRFLDLQKAEAQAREAQIEAALEKVRSRSLAMHQAEELGEVAAVVFEKLRELNIPVNDGVAIVTHIEGSKDQIEWMENPDYSSALKVFIPYFDHPVLSDYWKAKNEGLDFIAPRYTAEENKSFLNHIFEYSDYKYTPQEIKDYCLAAKTYSYSAAFQKNSSIFINDYSGGSLSEQEIDIVKRFSKVFEQAYVRFLDLQKAEAQAREAQIEAALEKVRSRTMGMQHSNELQDAAMLLFQQVEALGVPVFGCGFNIWDDNQKAATAWMAGKDRLQPPFKTSSSEDIFLRIYEAARRGESLFVEEQGGEALKVHYEYMNSIPVFKEIADKMATAGQTFPTFQIIHCAFFSHGYLMFISFEPVQSAYDIFKRFAKVFEQTYTRFLDLQKAEAQAREALIESSLEKVRSRSLAMHKTEELNELIGLMFTELSKLDVILLRCLIVINESNNLDQRWWMANSEDPDNPINFFIKYIDMPPNRAFVDAWKKRAKKWIYKMEGSVKKEWDQRMLTETELSRLPETVKIGMSDPAPTYVHASLNNFGCLSLVSPEPISDEQFELLIRFSRVFDQAYTRFNDIQKAEIQAMEAVKQASLDRLRGEIASMRTTDDLERITPLIWKELRNLSIPFIRCGVFIMDGDQRIIHNYLSTPDGEAIAAFDLPYDTPGFVTNVLQHWMGKEIYIEHWNASAMADFAKVLVQQNIFSSPDQYLQALPKEGFYLHLLPFLQGMLYVGNLTQFGDDQMDILQSVANAFSAAYARYDDFNRLELAKKQVDRTLVELKQAQQQLIQSEKMASLGELTAGIAHEIQNPLNFVNNFSEVNKELIAELEEAILQGNYEDVKAIANDLAGNQEKINHHGKRAEGIVKGMLQHSRSSTGQKELTDLNALCDEYLRLAYHGFRAKDKSFNAEYKLNLDPSLPQVNVVPQEIGRVLLNLINNAFQAVAEVENAKVTLITQQLNNSITIRVTDNGPGIPEEIRDKIFQPFFTTKPAGQGTGLGLSLSYDIIIAHGGSLRLNSQKVDGTEFIIELPIL